MRTTSKTHKAPLEEKAVLAAIMTISKLEREQEDGITCRGEYFSTLPSPSVH